MNMHISRVGKSELMLGLAKPDNLKIPWFKINLTSFVVQTSGLKSFKFPAVGEGEREGGRDCWKLKCNKKKWSTLRQKFNSNCPVLPVNVSFIDYPSINVIIKWLESMCYRKT